MHSDEQTEKGQVTIPAPFLFLYLLREKNIWKYQKQIDSITFRSVRIWDYDHILRIVAFIFTPFHLIIINE